MQGTLHGPAKEMALSSTDHCVGCGVGLTPGILQHFNEHDKSVGQA